VGLFKLEDEGQLSPVQGINGECWQMIQTKNRLIIASTNGLFSYQNGSIKNLIPNQTFVHVQQSNLSDKIFAFAQEAIYTLEYKNDNFLVSKLSGIDELANSCFEEKDGSIWIGTYYNGLKKFKNGKILNIELREEIKDGKCTIKRYEKKMLVIAKEKVFVANGSQFIIEENISNLFNHASNKNFDFKSSDFAFTSNQIRVYENGKTLESSTLDAIDGKPVSICSHQNSEWLATEDKIICIEQQNPSNVKPLASINGIKNALGEYIYDNQNSDESTIPKINQNESHFTVEFGINSFINAEKNAYRYRIKQISDAWSEWQKASTLELTGLTSGNYCIELQAKNAEGLISESTELTFQSLAPWYLTRYAIMVYISIGLLMVLLIIKLNSNRLLAKNKKLEVIVAERTTELSEKNIALTDEKKKSDALLLNILPAEVAEELKTNGFAKARQFENVTLIFTDFVNFTGISEKLSPQQLVEELDFCFKGFDEIIERHQLEKIKTIGDAYLAACGMPHEDPKHALKVVKAAQEILQFVQKRKSNGGLFDIRIGIHSGPIIAGIVGNKKYAYDIWGDTVNTAARMEQNSEAHKINISETTYNLVKNNFAFISRGKIIAKNKGEMSMYYLDV
jgi:class 3 adenylate cyclase